MTFHAKDGFYFTRNDDGSVTIRVRPAVTADGLPDVAATTLEASGWASVVAAVCARGEDGPTWREALDFHNLGAGPFVPGVEGRAR